MPGANEMLVPDKTGHSTYTWDSSKSAEVENARKQYNDLKAKGYKPFKMKKNGDKGKAMDTFDPNAERIFMLAPMVGG